MKVERMRAVVITEHGGVDKLEVREVDGPGDATANRVRVRVRAAALNRADVLQRLGHYPAPHGISQEIPGLEFAGEVDQVGEEVRAWRTGQRVFGIAAGGAQAEYVIVPENTLVEIPPNLNWAEAAAVPEVFITAHDALFSQGGLEMGERVLIHAVGSGVGTAAAQLAHAMGVVVFGTSRTQAKLDKAREFGLDEPILVGDDPQVFVEAVKKQTNGAGVDVILDLVGGAYLSANLEALTRRGRMMFVGTTAGTSGSLDISQVMRKRLHLVGTVLRTRAAEEKARATRRFASHVVPLLARGSIRPVIDKIYRMEDIRAAHERIESNESFGKIVLMIGD